MINKLAVYDFDGTLFDTPLKERGMEIWKQKTGSDYPFAGWWGKPESLNTDIFEIRPYPNVLNQLNKDMAKSDTYTVLLTSRIERLRQNIEGLLKTHNIKVDEVLLKRDELEKDVRISEILDKFPLIKEVNIYDDRDKEFEIFNNFKKNNPDIKVNIYKAYQGTLSTYSAISESELKSVIDKTITEFFGKTNKTTR